jgi:cytochrome c oxidase assembly protein subunit 15
MTTVNAHLADTSNPAPHSTWAVGLWLLACAGMVLTMVVIGGVTRLTGSGLSMVEWRPVYGFLPPLSGESWQRVFDLYRATPQYLEMNVGMTLDAFREIFWWEYFHRLWGRVIGLVFFLPFLWFLVRGSIRGGLTVKLLGIFILGGAQGALGWYMVKSGLVDIPEVSQYRLTAHLSLAFLIYALLVWNGLSLVYPHRLSIGDAHHRHTRRLSLIALTLVAVTIVSGAFVAGTDAGMVFNTFPLMEGRLLPPGYFHTLSAPFEDHGTIQFNHRLLALTSFVLVVWVWWRSRWLALIPRARRAANILLAAAFLQVGLGMGTLLLAVPVHLAACHQAGAVILFTATIWFVFELRPPARR